MSLHLHFEIAVDEMGISQYKERYPDFSDETAAEILIREAIAAWDWEALLQPFKEPVATLEQVSTYPALSVACPHCGAEPGQHCLYYGSRRPRGRVYWTHTLRTEALNRAIEART
ncbi:MAG: hypothetical protein AB7E70_20270 [Hyphomicrobiaceae bacterium]